MILAPRLRRSESGETLVLVLAFLIAIGLLVGAVADHLAPSLAQTEAVNAANNEVAAANQGIQYGLQTLKSDSTYCASPNVVNSLPDYVTLDSGLTVHVECETTQGFAAGSFGWAVITNDTGPAALTDSSGGTKTVTGPVFNAGGFNLNPAHVLTIMDGKLVDTVSGCTGSAGNGPGGTGTFADVAVNPDPPFASSCSTPIAMPVPVPAHILPPLITQDAATPNTGLVPGCTILYPGLYTSANPPPLSGDVYMVSGNYYFDNLGNMQVGNTLFGGQPTPPEAMAATSGSPCATDVSARATGNGFGVEIIFGGNTTLSIGNNSTMELYTRTPSSNDGSTPGITLYQVPCLGAWSVGCSPQAAGWDPTSLPQATQFVSMGNGAHVWGLVHGAVFGPQGSIGVFATNSSQAVLDGGTDVYDLTLQSSAAASGLLVAIGQTPGARYTIIKAGVQLPPAQGVVSSRAVVQIQNDATRDTSIDSWRTCQESDPSQVASDPNCVGTGI